MPSLLRRHTALLATGGVLAALVAVLPGASAAPVPDAPAAPVAGAPGAVWTPVSEQLRPSLAGLRRAVRPTSFKGFHLDLDAIDATLDRASSETASRATPVAVSVPAPTGELMRFAVEQTSVMEPGLAAAHPEVQTYSGRSLDGPASSIAISVTPFGLSASVVGAGPAWFVEPGYLGTDQGDDALYVSYFKAALPEGEGIHEPGYAAMVAEARRAGRTASGNADDTARRFGEGAGNQVTVRTYRLAFATDPTFATYFAAGATAPADVDRNVTDAKAIMLARVNQIYGADLSVKMVLVDETAQTNFNTTTAAYSAGGRCGAVACYTQTDVANGCSATLLNRNREVLGVVVGANNYDVGHIGLGLNGGGIAGLGVVGLAGKARGCTGLTTPTGDFYAVDYVAHEIGHQFAGNHTFDGVFPTCGAPNRNSGTSVEPGAGSSVMAYAGICGTDNTQPHSDPYFSQRTQTEIGAHITTAPAKLNEIASVQLVGFDGTDSFSLTFPGLGAGGADATTAPITNGTTYSAAGIKAAVEAAIGGTATVGNYMAGAAFDATGFQVTFSGTRAGQNIPDAVVTVVGGDFTGRATDVVKGDLNTRGGHSQRVVANRVPSVTAPAAKTIPVRTPFELTGSATDLDGDRMVYLWEQNDRGDETGTPLVLVPRPSGPLFRVFGTYADVSDANSITYHSPGQNIAGESPSRTFPDIEQIIAGNTNAATGTCGTPPVGTGTDIPPGPFLDCVSEQLPSAAWVGYDTDNALNFRFTARDLGGRGTVSDGGTDHADVKLTTDPTAGPFLVSSQSTATSVAGNAAGTVTWAVAGTNTAALATNVRIRLSTDGGRTYPVTLLESTPNDGSQAITWPNIATTKARVRVEAVDNYFFDINDADITITATPGLTLGGNTPGTFTVQHSDTPAPTPTITASSATADGSAITATPTGLPAGLTLTKVATSDAGVRPGTARFEVTGTANGNAGTSPVTVSVADGAAAPQTASFTVEVTKETAAVAYTGPTSAVASAGGTDAVRVTLTADVTEQADGRLGGLTETTATFTDSPSGEVLCTSPVTAGRASCDFGADLTGTDDRTYQVVVTLGGQRYTGATAQPTALVVRYDPGLVVTGPVAASGAQYSDALDPAVSLDVSARFVESGAFTATATGLPAGLALQRTAASGAGVLPGTATYAVTGAVTDVPGTYPVSITVGDGTHPDATKQVAITVSRESASATYTGPTQTVVRTRGAGVAPVTLTADVTPSADGTTGDVTTATATFVDQTDAVLCASPVSASGQASCSARLDAPASGDGTYQVRVVVGGRYVGGTAAATTLRVLVDEGLALSAPTSAAPSGQYSDPVTPTSSVTASARFVAAERLVVTASGLPAGLSLTRSGASADGVTPGQVTYTVAGATTAAPGSYPVTLTLADGGDHGPVARTLTVTVTREDATVSYTGPTRVTATPAETSKQLTMTARVTESGDTSLGDVTTATVTFRDTAAGTVLCADAPVTLVSPGVGTASCAVTATLPADDGRTYRVALTVGGRYTGASATDAAVVVDQTDEEPPAPGDTTPPQTTITGPTANGFVLTASIPFRYRSSEAGSTFACTLNGAPGVCPASGAASARALPGAYDVVVAATDRSGNTDTTPAERRFYVPTDDRALAVAAGRWKRQTLGRAYRGTLTSATRKGAVLTYRMAPATTLSVVAARGPRDGSIDVYLGNRRLRTISLRSRTQHDRAVLGVVNFGRPTSGVVRIVTRNNRPVRIDGIAPRTVKAGGPVGYRSSRGTGSTP